MLSHPILLREVLLAESWSEVLYYYSVLHSFLQRSAQHAGEMPGSQNTFLILKASQSHDKSEPFQVALTDATDVEAITQTKDV